LSSSVNCSTYVIHHVHLKASIHY